MQSADKFCQLCAESLEVSLSLTGCGDLTQFRKTLNFELTDSTIVCSKCFSFVGKIVKFIARCDRTHQFLKFIVNATNPDDVDKARREFGLGGDRNEQSTDTLDLLMEIKDEFVDTPIQDVQLDCDDAFNELGNFEEIPTVPVPDGSNFVIASEVLKDENSKIDDENDSADKKDENDMKLEYICRTCHENFKNFFSLQSHCREKHDTNAEIMCSCGTVLTSRAQIHVHKKLHKSFACSQCDKSYSHQQSLHTHIRKVHAETDNLVYVCSECPKRFENKRKLKYHQQKHLPEDQRYPVNCPYCDKKFSKAVNVQAHIKSIHHMERPFLCSDCGKDFSTKGALKEHQIIHSDSYPFQCSFCPKKFKNLPRLKTHEDTHNETQYICNICGISLNTKRTLKMHMVVHSDQKKYKCQYCGSSFKRSKALKNHLILHSGLRPYACPWCDKTFANGSNCRSHKKKAHPNELSAFEASGKSTNSAPNIPRLEQLQPKIQLDTPATMITVDGANMILHQMSDIKNELPSLPVIQHVENFQVQHASARLLDSQ